MPSLLPSVIWAQRANLIYLTICLEDVKDPVIKIDNEKLYFKGNGGTNKSDYETTLEFYEKLKSEESKYIVRERGIEFVLYKAEENYWPRLLKDNKKYHWLKIDFNKWKDEDDDSNDESQFNENSYEDMMRSLGGAGGAPDFGNFNLDGVDENEPDDSEEQLPELEEV